jgi:hypothetical protein
MKIRNWKGQMVEAPKDYKAVVISLADGYIVWSKSGPRHRVRYGLQVDEFTDSIDAAHSLGEAIHHHVQCEGKLD